MEKVSNYHPVLVALHWLLAFMILGTLYFGSTVLAHVPNDDPHKLGMLQAHMSAGAAIFVMMLVRILTRRWTRHPPKATAKNAWLDRIAFVSHRLLYVAVMGQVMSGIGLAFEADLPAIVFGRQGVLPQDLWDFPLRYAHYGFSRLLMALIALHVAGALWRRFVVKDDVMTRMVRPAR